MAIDLRTAIEDRLGRDVVLYAGGLKQAGRSWREIADEIKTRTAIDVSHESLRKWVQQDAAMRARAAS
jgi:hypothetical protein